MSELRYNAVAMCCYWYPGPAMVAFDQTGYLVIAHVENEYSNFGGSAFGVQTFSGSTSRPTLLFLRS